MRIGVFTYNFKHKKSYEGLVLLFLNGYQPECIIAANPVELNFYQSKFRITTKDLDYQHPKDIADKFNIPYHVIDHTSDDCIEFIKESDLDLGIILGARILKEKVIDSFNVGVLNMHPGLLPKNRGLDNIKWGVIDNIKQGVTTHLIDKYVDRGFLIDRKTIDVYEDDTLVDILLRLQNLELQMMIEFLDNVEDDVYGFEKIGIGTRYKSVPWEIEKNLFSIFEDYKKNYNKISDV